jgi:hypothetical protein
MGNMKLKRKVLISAVSVSVVLLSGSLAVPALGGPKAVSAVNALKMAKNALKKANQADQRSKQALAEAQSASARRGAQGPPGPQGAQGAPGPSGRDAFGSLTYVYGVGGATSLPDDYAVDIAFCPAGQAPTGGSFLASGGEQGGWLGDVGDGPIDTDDPSDGYVDAWLAGVYNATGSADVYASAICARAGSTPVAAKSGSPTGSRAEKLYELLRNR